MVTFLVTKQELSKNFAVGNGKKIDTISHEAKNKKNERVCMWNEEITNFQYCEI